MPALLTTVSCSAAGNFTLAVPAGTTSVDVDADADVVGAGGGAGYPARSHIGGNAAEVTGTLTLPAGTAFLYVIVGAAGTGDNHGSGIGGGASAVFAEDSGLGLLAKLVVAGAGGSGSYNGDGGNAGSAGTSENISLSTAGSPGIGATGGAGGSGNYAAGGAGGSNNTGALTVAAGGNGGGVPGGAYGGGGCGGYSGGGGGTSGVLTRNVAAGGSPITSYQYSTDGGQTWLPLTTAASGSQLTGTITGLTSGNHYSTVIRGVNSVGDGVASTTVLVSTLPAAVGKPTAQFGVASAIVTWTASATSSVTGYTVLANPGPATCTTTARTATSCVIGATTGVSYTYTVIAHSAGADSPSSPASTPTVAAAPPVPADAPLTAPTILTTANGSLITAAAGQHISVLGSGFLPYSSVTIVVYSKPEGLGTSVTDVHGDFTRAVTLPTDLTPGHHDLVASGVTRTGASRYIRMPFTAQRSPPRPVRARPSRGPAARSTLAAPTPIRAATAHWPTPDSPPFNSRSGPSLTTAAGMLLMTVNRRRNRA